LKNFNHRKIKTHQWLIALSCLLLCLTCKASFAAAYLNYDLYKGDVDGNGVGGDYYFQSPEQIFVSFGGISHFVDGPPAYAVYHDSTTGLYSDPAYLRLTEAQISSLGLSVAANDSDYYLASDVDANGRHDLLLLGVSDPLNSVVLLAFYNQLPTLVRFPPSGVLAGYSGAVVSIADYDGDTYLDLYIESLVATSNQYQIAYGNASGQFSGLQVTQGYIASTPPAPAAKPTVDSALVTTSAQIGSTAGVFRVGESGAATYGVPITLAPGIAGVTPQLSLNYSSQAGNGLVGKGWLIGGLSTISRCRQTLHQDGDAKPIAFSSEDRFCLDGQRLILNTGTYGHAGSTYKTEIDSFAIVTAVGGSAGHPDSFSVRRKDGSNSFYGATDNAIIAGDSANTSATTLAWSISRFTDSMGNAIDYSYYNDSDGQRLHEIRYAYNAVVSDATGSAGSYHANVVMSYESRSSHTSGTSHIDNLSSFVAGHRFDTKKRLSGIEVKSLGTQFRHYSLDYKESESDALIALSRLESITECANGTCLPATEFTWLSPQEPTSTTVYYEMWGQQIPVATTSSGYGFESSPSSTITLAPESDRVALSHKFADINGDGIQDGIWVERIYDSGGDVSTRNLKYALGDGNGFATPTSISIPSSGGEENSAYQLYVIDYNGDGRSDILLRRDAFNDMEIFLAEPNNTTWQLSSSVIDLGFSAYELWITDMNADGMADMVYRDVGVGIYVRYLQHTNQSDSSPTFYGFTDEQEIYHSDDVDLSDINVDPHPDNYFEWWFTTGVSPDFNGDGRVDMLLGNSFGRFAQGPIGTLSIKDHQFETLISTDNGLESYSDVFPHTFTQAFKPDAMAVDLNADGLTDLLYRQATSLPNLSWRFALSNGVGFEADQVIVAESEVTERHDITSIQLFDYNHDGHSDVVWHNTTDNRLEGKLWQPENNTFGDIFTVRTTNGDDKEAHFFVDIDGDANPDYIHFDAGTLRTYLSKGAGEPRHVIARITNGFGAETDIVYGALSTGGRYERATVSTNTTEQEFCEVIPAPFGGGEYCGSYTLVTANADDFYENINGPWKLPAGAHTLGKDSNNDNEYDPVLELNGPIYVVNEVASSAPVAGLSGAKSSVSYRYGEAKLQASGRGMLGFERLKTIDNQTGITTTTTYRQDFPFIGTPLRTEVRRSDGLLISEADNHWELQGWDGVSVPPSSPYRPYLRSTTDKQYDLETGSLLTQVDIETLQNNIYGNVDQITVTTTGDGHTYKQTTVNTFDSTSTWTQETGRLTKVEVTKHRDEVDVAVRTSSFTYYSESEGGLLKDEIIEPDNSVYKLTTSYTYDTYGNKVLVTQSGTDILSRTSTLSYTPDAGSAEPTGRYLVKAHNADGQLAEHVQSRNSLGQPLSVSDIHGVVTTFEYDDFGTLYLEYSATGAYNRMLKVPATTDCPTDSAFMQSTLIGGGASSAVCFDILARPVRALTSGFDDTLIYQDTEYDWLNRVERVSLPYFEYNTPGTNDWTINEFDDLGRMTLQTQPDLSTVSTDYQERTTVTTNAKSQTHTETKNAIGELVSAKDSTGVEIKYTYYESGDLKSTQVVGTNYADGINSTDDPMITTMTYDLLGRKTTLTDPDKGYWQYTDYNVLGELEEQINANGQKVAMVYDVMGRMTQRTDYSDTSAVQEVTDWIYDDATSGNGLLVSEETTTTDQFKQYFYDGFGRLDHTDNTLANDGTYTEQTTYDAFGRVFQTFDATGKGVEYTYNSYGYMNLILNAYREDGIQAPLYEVTAMNPRRQVISAILSNGYTTQTGYDPATGRITSLTTDLGGGYGQVQSIVYLYDALGNVRTRTNTSGSKNLTEGFCYDNLNRLTQVHQDGTECSGADQITYDDFGNIKTKNGVTYTYGTNAGPHAVTNANGIDYTFDANGNMTSDDDRDITYSTFDKPTSISKGSDTVSFTYGADRSRFKRVDTTNGVTTTTLYIGNVEKVINHADNSYSLKRYVTGSALWTEHYDSNDNLTGSDRQNLLKDNLGSIDVILDDANIIDKEISFDAWGQRRGVDSGGSIDWELPLGKYLPIFDTSITTRGFTSHEHVDSVGVIHMNGRIYDPELGRFLQADPYIQAPSNTQNYNRYSYTINNPLAYTDPSGYSFWKSAYKAHMKLDGRWATQKFFNRSAASSSFADTVQVGLNSVPFFGQLASSHFAFDRSFFATGSFGPAIRSGLISYVSSEAFTGIGDYFGPVVGVGVERSFGSLVAQGVAHGVVGGVVSVLQDGKFGHGFVSAGVAFGVGAAGEIRGWGEEGMFAATVVAGGTVSHMTGGKFANGAVTAAYGFIYNQMKHQAGQKGGGPASDTGRGAGDSVPDPSPSWISRVKLFFGLPGGKPGNVATGVGGTLVNTGIKALNADVAAGVAAVSIRKNLNMCEGAGNCWVPDDAITINGHLSQKPPNYKGVGNVFIRREWEFIPLTKQVKGL
jgi:RHS repeat-associated protein